MSTVEIVLWMVGIGIAWMLMWAFEKPGTMQDELNHKALTITSLVMLPAIAIILASGLLLAGRFSWSQLATVSIAYAIVFYLAQVGAYSLRKWNYRRWLRKEEEE